MSELISSLEAEFRRYRAIGESTLGQLRDHELTWRPESSENSVSVIVCHVAGNLKSRFSDFLTSDGEKPWRDRDLEFTPRTASRRELMDQWNDGWGTLFESLARVTDQNLLDTVRIRGQELTVHHALCRSVSHTSYHVGQMVSLARQLRGPSWKSLSIPPGGSKDYNRSPDPGARSRPRLTRSDGRQDAHGTLNWISFENELSLPTRSTAVTVA